eukprot:CAMPEP_0185028914 /NCGR_PEP_ID=MMETSP1103-20130426/14997_1 /TAXON_ID=36769 /ORGANISM="Paraphysomonas bandaiensis, Strain Caron Lab Isolate" /LENGTH=262 /DNA_ID=CAMNT_0027563493 /DNA_START=109 /DNA_END=897 /DNA_ORIENTATION=+
MKKKHDMSTVTPLCPYSAYQLPLNDTSTPDQVRFISERLPDSEAALRAQEFHKLQNQRRSMRYFSRDTFPLDNLLTCIATAGTAPSGAHQQPWHFCIVRDQRIKDTIRDIVEKEEQVNYDKRMKKTWVNDLKPIFANASIHKDGVVTKPYLSEAPYLVVVTELMHGIDRESGKKLTHYYVKEGVGIAVGLFISALTNIGLFTLTSTPLNAGSSILQILNRPLNEKLFLLMPVGYPALDATVPYRGERGVPLRKNLSDITTLY